MKSKTSKAASRTSCWFPAWLTLQPRRRRRHIPPKHALNFNGLQGVISQKIELFNLNIGYGQGTIPSPPVLFTVFTQNRGWTWLLCRLLWIDEAPLTRSGVNTPQPIRLGAGDFPERTLPLLLGDASLNVHESIWFNTHFLDMWIGCGGPIACPCSPELKPLTSLMGMH
jgi:hypothetical protein